MPSFVNGSYWDKYLKNWTELVQPYPTCFTAASGSSARLDRGFSAAPPHKLMQIQVSSNVLSSPEDYEARGLSDHAPVVFSFFAKNRIKTLEKTTRPIPRFICKDPQFARLVEVTAEAVGLQSLEASLQLPVLNTILQDAGQRIRDDIFPNFLILPILCRMMWNRIGWFWIPSPGPFGDRIGVWHNAFWAKFPGPILFLGSPLRGFSALISPGSPPCTMKPNWNNSKTG